MSMTKLTTEEVVGNYGTFGNPVIEVNGEQHVCEPYFVDSEGNPLYPACQSVGCGYCTGNSTVEGCRNVARNSELRKEWFY